MEAPNTIGPSQDILICSSMTGGLKSYPSANAELVGRSVGFDLTKNRTGRSRVTAAIETGILSGLTAVKPILVISKAVLVAVLAGQHDRP